MRTLLVFILVLTIAGCAETGKKPHRHDQFTKHYEGSLFKVTEKGMYSVEVVVKDHALRTGVNTADLIFHDSRDRDLVGAEVTVTPWMPEMGHGVFEKPVVVEKGGGLYTVENIILIMSGHWELRVNVKRGDMEDSVVFDFPDVQADTEHRHETEHPPAPEDIDLSASKMSDNQLFRVSYHSELEPVPINQIHSWRLDVETADGQPLTGAEISIDGDMPEHGHGLPTRPEVTMELTDGQYLIEGVKFSMPGLWVINFIIMTPNEEDNVSFNLLLEE